MPVETRHTSSYCGGVKAKLARDKAEILATTQKLEEQAAEAKEERAHLLQLMQDLDTKFDAVQKAQDWLRSKVLGHDGRLDALESLGHQFVGHRAWIRRENAKTRGDMAKHEGRIGTLEGGLAELVISYGDEITPLYFYMCAILAIVLYSSSDQYEFMFEFEIAEQLKVGAYIAAVLASLVGLIVLKCYLKKGYAACKKWTKQD